MGDVHLIPNRDLHDDVVEKRSDDNLLKDWDRKAWREAEGRIAQIFSALLLRSESVKKSA